MGMLCIYWALNHIDHNALYMNLNVMDIKLNALQCDAYVTHCMC